MERRSFIRALGLAGLAIMVPVKTFSINLYQKGSKAAKQFVEKIIRIVKALHGENSSIVTKVMDGKEYVFDPYTHYPYDGGIVDENTDCRVFFHAHRENEYGHFHTFIEDEEGDLIHLILISMNEKGEPVELATVNRWVTGDKYLKADKLRTLFDKFKMDRNLFPEERLIDFVEYVFKAYKKDIYRLFEERDKWIYDYSLKYYREPFEDREHEILSSMDVNIYKDKA